MSAVVKAVVGIVLIVVGAYFDQPWLIKLGAALLLTAAASLFIKANHSAPIAGISINYTGTLEPRRIIYGTLKMGGLNVLPPLTSGSNNDYLHQVLAFGGEQISGFGDVYFNQIRIANADIGALPTGAVGGTGPYNGKAWIRRYDGSQVAVDGTLFGNFSAWDVNHIGFGIPYAAIMLQWDQNVYSDGFPQITFVVQGKKIYDPRQDSTNGGSGSQRYGTPSTWTYSTNPALCLRDYLTSALGLLEAQTRIDDTLVAAAANICDQTCSVPIPVLVGLTNWTNGSTAVTGINTVFTRALSSGAYLKAPNGTMVQISGSPTNDTNLVLLAAYGGASATSQVTQYNNAGSATTVTQPRYTCNCILDATATFNTNIGQLVGAMMGCCLYSAGKWRMYAGAWSGSAFTLGPDDIVGNVQVQCGTPRANLYNAVRGNFLDPQQNYAASEFPPIVNAGYAALDGETIYIETSFACCTDRFEAQRNAMILNRQGRNQKTITVQYGMTAFGVKVYETGTVSIPEIGWNGQTVRCTGWRFNPQGMIELTLQEAYSNDFTDPLATDYAVTGVNVGPQAGKYTPYAPSGLTATSVAGGISFKVTLPGQVLPGSRIQLFEYTANTPFSSSTLIAVETTDNFFVPKFDTITRYYWVRTLSPQEQVSTSFPAGNGVAGVALSASQAWDPIGNLLTTASWPLPGPGGTVGNYTEINSNTAGSNVTLLAGDPANSSPLGPFGHSEVIWRAVGGTGGSGATGWTNSGDLPVPPLDPTKSYRFSVWFQYTGTASGAVYCGCDAGGNTYNLSPRAADTNPYFCYLNLSNLTAGRWYLFVGVMHAQSYTGAQSGISGIYDPTTGDRVTTGANGFSNLANVATGADFQFKPSATGQLFRTFLNATANATTRGYWARPRIEMINGQEPSVRDLLTPGVVDPTATPAQIPTHAPRHGILPRGNVMPMVQDQAFSYTSTTTSINITWNAFTNYRPDGSSYAVTSGSQNTTGLVANTAYTAYAYALESAPGTILLATGFAGQTGTPADLNPPAMTLAQLAAAAAATWTQATINLGKLSVVTPAAGTGGGGGGGGGGCPHPDTEIETLERGLVRAGDLMVGEHLFSPDKGVTEGARVTRITHAPCSCWYAIRLQGPQRNVQKYTVTPEHIFFDGSGKILKARSLQLESIVAADGKLLRVVGLTLVEQDDCSVTLELAAPHLYYMRRGGPLSHNPKP